MNQFNNLLTTVNLGIQTPGLTEFSLNPQTQQPVESSLSMEVIFYEAIDPASLDF